MKRPTLSTGLSVGFVVVVLLVADLIDGLDLGLCIPIAGLLWLGLVFVPLILGAAIRDSE